MSKLDEFCFGRLRGRHTQLTSWHLKLRFVSFTFPGYLEYFGNVQGLVRAVLTKLNKDLFLSQTCPCNLHSLCSVLQVKGKVRTWPPAVSPWPSVFCSSLDGNGCISRTRSWWRKLRSLFWEVVFISPNVIRLKWRKSSSSQSVLQTFCRMVGLRARQTSRTSSRFWEYQN